MSDDTIQSHTPHLFHLIAVPSPPLYLFHLRQRTSHYLYVQVILEQCPLSHSRHCSQVRLWLRPSRSSSSIQRLGYPLSVPSVYPAEQTKTPDDLPTLQVHPELLELCHCIHARLLPILSLLHHLSFISPSCFHHCPLPVPVLPRSLPLQLLDLCPQLLPLLAHH